MLTYTYYKVANTHWYGIVSFTFKLAQSLTNHEPIT